jgi:ring-1,2-phenylacetyl-CoA epoxidase subunit PaaD
MTTADGETITSSQVDPEAGPRSRSAGRPSRERLIQALQDVVDPEIPAVSVVEMGMIHVVEIAEDGRVDVEILPTFSGCPALALIVDSVRSRLAREPGVREVAARVVHDPLWSTDRISAEGRDKLKGFGIAPAPLSRGRPLAMLGAEPVACPYCGSTRTSRENLFGPTPCRSLYRCRDCRNPFERFKAL